MSFALGQSGVFDSLNVTEHHAVGLSVGFHVRYLNESAVSETHSVVTSPSTLYIRSSKEVDAAWRYRFIVAKIERFDEDLAFLLSKLGQGLEIEPREKLEKLRDRLVELYRANLVKINHSVMEMVCAKHLIMKDYDVDVEHPLEGGLTCDLFGTKGYGSQIVEIETGFIPPEHALDPSGYIEARIASKIVRYSSQAGKFALGIPPHYVLRFPETFTVPPRKREEEDLRTIKKFCDLYYQNPPVTIEEVKNARLYSVYIVDVDNAQVREFAPEDYLKNKAVL